MNVLERAECLLDAGSSGNMNFTVIAGYRGPLGSAGLQQALAVLQAEHQLLRSTLLWEGDHCRFAACAAPIPVTVQPWPANHDPQVASQAWKPVAMEALRQRFSGGGEPLWRVSWLAGDAGGELLLTFHHGIADGLSAMALVQRLFALLAAAADGSEAPPQPDWDAATPDLSQAFASPRPEPPAVSHLPDRQDVGLSTSYGLEQLSAPATQAVMAWTRQRGLRLNATLHAAFLQALVAAEVLPAQTTATTVVNLRNLAAPALPWELMRLLRVCVDTPVAVDPEAPLELLAGQLHRVLQRQLQEGAPLQALDAITAALDDGPSPQQLWQRSWRQGGLITNLGRVPVHSQHGTITLQRLFFVANVEPVALPDRPLAVLGALTFNEQLSLTCFHIEQQLDDRGAADILADMKGRLLSLR
ncbi:phthiocerol/phthiodiolone dimycocerosyl transferase family protein [Synechococcus sp. CS-1328]|uniref:phthiocerol/phthiodiolone dimycocerosyl transferase family protein n=1 Tax=Synechococcus sp. CS-1328 TaxID=2847976 RepID=UPI00223B8E76|nr:condensation domain-containing protein [Synechococcus sp. CS-1328]